MGDGWHQQTLRKVNAGKQKHSAHSQRGGNFINVQNSYCWWSKGLIIKQFSSHTYVEATDTFYGSYKRAVINHFSQTYTDNVSTWLGICTWKNTETDTILILTQAFCKSGSLYKLYKNILLFFLYSYVFTVFKM